MQALIHHIRKYRSIAILWLVVFSLAPCTVKEVWSSVAGFDYSKPLNRSQTTASAQQCLPAGLSDRKLEIAPQYQINRKLPSSGPDNNTYSRAALKKLISVDPGYYPGSGPPPYILYKQLKLDMM